MLTTECEVHRYNLWARQQLLTRSTQLLRLHWFQSSGYYCISVKKGHLPPGDTANFFSYAFVDLVSHRHHAQFAVVWITLRSEVDRLQSNLIEMSSTKPPMSWRIFGKRIPQKLLCCFSCDSGILRVLGDNSPRTIAKEEDIA